MCHFKSEDVPFSVSVIDDEQPVFAKAGAIVPLMPHKKHENETGNPSELEVLVFPGASNTFTMYEDDGESRDYETGASLETTFTLDWEARTLRIEMSVDLTLVPANRTLTVLVRGIVGEGDYDAETQTLHIPIDELKQKQTVTQNAHRLDRLYRFLDRAEIAYDLKDRLYQMATTKTRLETWLFDLHALEFDRDLQDALLELMLD